MDWNTIEKGYLGQNLVEREFIKNGFNLFKPLLENGKVDLIVEKNNVYYRIQIKTIQEYKDSKLIPVRKISHNMGEYKIKTYTKSDIDFFIGVFGGDPNSRNVGIKFFFGGVLVIALSAARSIFGI